MQYGSPLLQAETGVMVSPYWSPLLFFFLFCVSFLFFFFSLFASLYLSPLFRQCSIVLLHPCSRWKLAEINLVCIFLSVWNQARAMEFRFFFFLPPPHSAGCGKKRSCIWGKPPTKYHCGIDCSEWLTQCVLRCWLTLWRRGEEGEICTCTC